MKKSLLRITVGLLAVSSELFVGCTSGFAGTVVGWGSNGSGELTIPAGATNVVAVAAGLNSSLLLNPDGTMTALGATYSGPPMPTDLTNVAAISGRAAHNVILRFDGTVAAWGDGYGSKSYLPAGISNIVAVGSGFEHSLFLKNDGTVFGWGTSYVDPVGLSNVVAISGGGYFSVALKGDGTVAAWGDDYYGQTDLPLSLTNVVAISAGGYHTVALRGDGTVVVWGDNSAGQLQMPSDLTNVVAVAAGWYHSLALKADGHVVAWGYNFAGQTDVPTDLSNVVAIAAGYTHNLAIVGGQAPQMFQSPLGQTVIAGSSALFMSGASGARPFAYQWKFNGTNLDGKTSSALLLTNVQPSQAGFYSVAASNAMGGVESSNALLTVLPFVLTSPTNQTRYVGDDISIPVGLQGVGPFAFQWQFNGTNLLDETNAVLLLRNANTNQTGNYSVTVSNIHASIQSSNALITVLDSAPLLVTSPVDCVTWPGSSASFQVAAEGTKPLYYQWQFKGGPLSGATNATLTLTGLTTNQGGAYTVTVSNLLGNFTTAYANLTLVSVAAWGGTAGNVTCLPTTLTDVISVAAGGYSHGLALKPNGTVVSWGVLTSVPSSVTNVMAIAAASYQSLALRSNGTVVAWPTITTVPADVTNVMAIAAGGYSSGMGCFAVKSNGTVRAWGAGGVGVGGITNVPAGLNGVISISAGKYHALALRGDGTVREWANSADANANAVPTNVNDVVAVSACGQHSLALRADGTVCAWGSDSYGETHVPSGLSNVVAVAASEENSIALKSDGSVTIWGRNNFGQTNIVAGVSNVVEIGGGLDYNLVRLGNTNLTIVRQPRAVASLPRQQVLLSVGVVCPNPFTYQWQFRGTNISGATNSVHRIPVVGRSDEGNYRVLLRTGSLIVTSAVAQVSLSGNSVIAWGNNASGQTNVPPGLSALAVAGGLNHSLALRVDGTIAAWGTAAYGVTNVPANASNVIAIAAGTRHNLALRSDGKVVSWGDVTFGKTTAPASLSRVRAIAAGDTFSLALKSDGTVEQWGSLAAVPAGLSNVVSLAAGYTHALAAKSDGTALTWGTSPPAVPDGLTNVIAVAAGNGFSLALLADGTVRAWGANNHGQINVPPGLSNVVTISAGGCAAHALKADGTFVTWGCNLAGLTNPPAGLGNVLQTAGGDLHSLALIGSTDPAIVRQPAPTNYAPVLDRVFLSVGAISAAPLNFQWRRSGTNIAGATNATLCLPVAQTNDTGLYSVIVGSSLGDLVTSNAYLQVMGIPPSILTQPPGQTNVGGAVAVLQVTATGTPPLTYQWRKNGSPITDATNSALQLSSLRRTNEGSYAIVVSNQFGSVTSSNAALRVLVPQQLRLLVLDANGHTELLFSDGDDGLLASNDVTHFEVQASTNLASWQTLANSLTLTNGMLLLRDTDVTNVPQRFYRVIEQP